MQLHALEFVESRFSPTGDNILPDDEKKPIEIVVDSSPGANNYGFTIRNTSTIDLYAYLFYFDSSTLEIDAWCSPPRPRNNRERGKVDPNLPRSLALTLGYGSGGMNPIQLMYQAAST